MHILIEKNMPFCIVIGSSKKFYKKEKLQKTVMFGFDGKLKIFNKSIVKKCFLKLKLTNEIIY